MKHENFPVTHTDAEWRKILTPEQYAIMREHGTERPGSCALNCKARQQVHLRGLRFAAVRLETKFESGTGRASTIRRRARSRRRWIAATARGAHRSALRPLRLASRPCLPRRPAANHLRFGHQRRGDELQAGLSGGYVFARR